MLRNIYGFGLVCLIGLMSSGCGDRARNTDTAGESLKSDKQANAEELIRLNVYALEIYRMHIGNYPDTEPGLVLLREQPQEEKARDDWRGPYLPNEIPVNDPWGRPLVYQRSENGSTYSLKSLGPDPQDVTDDLLAHTLMPRLFEEMHKLDKAP